MVVGLGTGSTVRYFIEHLSLKVKEGLNILGVATSVQTERWATNAGIELTTLEKHKEIDVAIDGADEVDPALNLIKGMGGALFREKIVAKTAKQFIVIIDSSKLVKTLGEHTPVPVEMHQFGWKATMAWLSAFNCATTLRKEGGSPFITDNGNFIVDCTFELIDNPAELEMQINNVPGVVDNGIFINMADLVIVGKGNEVKRLERIK